MIPDELGSGDRRTDLEPALYLRHDLVVEALRRSWKIKPWWAFHRRKDVEDALREVCPIRALVATPSVAIAEVIEPWVVGEGEKLSTVTKRLRRLLRGRCGYSDDLKVLRDRLELPNDLPSPPQDLEIVPVVAPAARRKPFTGVPLPPRLARLRERVAHHLPPRARFRFKLAHAGAQPIIAKRLKTSQNVSKPLKTSQNVST
ncbi:MAG: hypothetical protein GY772_20965, partial [bacterium]|nr:hypothetical protein [bacterium]